MNLLKKILFLTLITFGSKAQTMVVSPNPFVSRTSVSYTVPVADSVHIYIANNLAKPMITILPNTFLLASDYQDSLVMDTFPDGTYFLVMQLSKRVYKTMYILKWKETGTEEFSQLSKVSVFPNPVADNVQFEILQQVKNIDRLSVVNAYGKTVLEFWNLKKVEFLDVSFLPSGIYFLALEYANRRALAKFIKN